MIVRITLDLCVSADLYGELKKENLRLFSLRKFHYLKFISIENTINLQLTQFKH